MTVHIGRIYDDVAVGGRRVLIDRLWPRGVSKADAELDLWAKAVAPSDELRRWYHADRSRFEAFAERYRAELGSGAWQAPLAEVVALARDGDVILLTAAKDVPHSHAPILADTIRGALQAM